MAWGMVGAIIGPESCPPVEMTDEQRKGLPMGVVSALVPPMVLILAVLGSILGGLATPTESASVGAMGAMLLAALKGKLTHAVLRDVMRSTLLISSMVFVILLGASVFSLVFRGLGGEELVFEVLSQMPGGQAGAVLTVMAVMFFLGFFLDTFEIIFITVPITAPILIKLGVDPIWLGVIIGMNLQTSFLTPPFGFALFYLRGVADKVIATMQIYRGAVPFVGLQLAAILILWFVPSIATWLPEQLFSSQAVQAGTVSDQLIPMEGRSDGINDDFRNLFSDEGDLELLPDGQAMDPFDNLLEDPSP